LDNKKGEPAFGNIDEVLTGKIISRTEEFQDQSPPHHLHDDSAAPSIQRITPARNARVLLIAGALLLITIAFTAFIFTSARASGRAKQI
jgi:hypothetical protein